MQTVKKAMILAAVLFIAVVFVFTDSVFASGGLSSIQQAQDENAMEVAIRDNTELSDEADKLISLDTDMKNAVLSSVFRRRNTVSDIDGFKAMFAEQYDRKTAKMNWVSGYPYISDVGDNGAKFNVKTDNDGWVYIISFGDDVQGGLSDEYSFMKFYNADNGAYKQKVWVQGGVESNIDVSSASWASGSTYRIYYCLRTAGNESGFGLAKYTAPKFWYNIEMLRSEMKFNIDGPAGNEAYFYYDYYFYLTSSHELLFEARHFIPFIPDIFYEDAFYSTPGQSVMIDKEFTADFEIENYVDTRITTPTGGHYFDYFNLPGPPID